MRLAVPATAGVLLISLPVLSVIVRAPWTSLGGIFDDPAIRQSLALSLTTSLIATGLSLCFGVPIAAILARTTSRGFGLLRAVVTLPIVLPPVVAGVALLLAFGRGGLFGQYLWQWFGVQLPFTSAAVVVAQTFVSMPFLVITIEGALRSSDTDLEDAAASAGATRLQILRLVTLPTVAPSIAAGAVLAWARALGEFGATVTFAGSFPGRTQTLPISVYYALETNPDAAIALSLLMIAIAVTVLVALRDRWLSQH